MNSSTIRDIGLTIMAAGVAGWLFRRRPRLDASRCCNDPHTCLCKLNETIVADILRAVRSIPCSS